MDKDLFQQIVKVLQPEMDDTNSRQSLVQSALHGASVLQRIQWGGSAYTFTVRLVQDLDKFGEVSPGKPAIVAMLEEIRKHVGGDRQTKIDELLAQLHSPVSPPAPRQAPPQPKPISPQAEPISPGSPKFTVEPPPKSPWPPAVLEVSAPNAESPVALVGEASAIPHPIINTPRWPRLQPFRPQMLVMKGGGVKGIAYVGALRALEEYGYRFDHFVGTSAGAISAALLAAGYSSEELGEILKKTNFKEFKDGWFLPSLLLLPFRKGLYQGDAFRKWLEKLLRKKYPKFDNAIPIKFKHLNDAGESARRLTVFASRKGRTAYCFDSMNPRDSETPISFACRCSMAIPYFFTPEKIEGEWVVDGGMQSNYPIDALLKYFPGVEITSNFIGLYLGPREEEKSSKLMLLNLFSMWQESGDEEAKVEFIDRTIIIDPRPVATTDFSLSSNDLKFLLAEGRASALHWLFHWSGLSDAEKPPLEVIESARQESEQLRNLIITERWRKFRLRIIMITAFILALTIIGAVFY